MSLIHDVRANRLYDAANRRTRLTYPDAYFVNYGYTSANELTSLIDSAGATLATYSLDNEGDLTSMVRPNGAPTNTVVDVVGRLQSMQHDLSGTSLDTTVGLTYNPLGQIVTRNQTNDAAYTWVPPTNATTTVSTPVNGQNRLTTFNSATVTHNGDGNVTGGLSTQTYSYDIEGRLTGASGGVSATVEYDPTGMLAKVTAGASVTEYLYDGPNLVAQYNGATLLRKFVHAGGIDAPVAWFEGSGTTNRRFLHADERGSVIAASDASGAAASTVKYPTYGESGSLASEFGYTGQLYIPALELYYYKARMYSPKAGRFMQADPIGYAGGMNLYGYVGGDPTNAVDPTGTCETHSVGGKIFLWSSSCFE